MITKIESRTLHDNKDDNKKLKRMSSRLSQEHFKNQEKFDFKIQESSFKIQVSRIKNQESRIKNNQVEDSRIKKRHNQDKY